MAKDKPDDPDRVARKAEKKALKEAKRSEKDGVHKSKKDKKSKDKAIDADAETLRAKSKLLDTLEAEKPGTAVVTNDEPTIELRLKPQVGALVPFALPLADEKQAKKIYKTVKKAHKRGVLKRGVKEVLKAIRKSSIPSPSSTKSAPYICILAGDISPPDVISHLPVLCEEHGIPYIFVNSRADLGDAGGAKRQTSVALIGKKPEKKKSKPDKDTEMKDGDEAGDKSKSKEEEVDDEWKETYKELYKLVEKAGQSVKI